MNTVVHKYGFSLIRTFGLTLAFIATQAVAGQTPRFYFDKARGTVVRPLERISKSNFLSVQQIFSPEMSYLQDITRLSPVIENGRSLKLGGETEQVTNDKDIDYDSIFLFQRQILSFDQLRPRPETTEWLSSKPSFIFENGMVVLSHRQEVTQEGSSFQQTFYYFIPSTQLIGLNPSPIFKKKDKVCLTKESSSHRLGQCGRVRQSFENQMSEVQFGFLGATNLEVVEDQFLVVSP